MMGPAFRSAFVETGIKMDGTAYHIQGDGDVASLRCAVAVSWKLMVSGPKFTARFPGAAQIPSGARRMPVVDTFRANLGARCT